MKNCCLFCVFTNILVHGQRLLNHRPKNEKLHSPSTLTNSRSVGTAIMLALFTPGLALLTPLGAYSNSPAGLTTADVPGQSEVVHGRCKPLPLCCSKACLPPY